MPALGEGARTREQRLTLQSLERLLDDAAIEAEQDFERGRAADAYTILLKLTS